MNSVNTEGIKVKNVDFFYPGRTKPILSNVSITVNSGAIFGLLGPNGAGKTTLISLLTGIIPVPKNAIISILGCQLPQQRKMIRSFSALVPQEYAFYPMLSARENLQHFCGLYGQDKKTASRQIEYCVHVCGLQDFFDQRAYEYSGGVKRRLNLAIGLLNNPKVLYLDEPTVGIDAQSRHFILEAIKKLKNEGMTVIYTSHYMDEIQRICDDIAIIDHGCVIASDSMSHFLNSTSRSQLHIDISSPLSKSLEHKLLQNNDVKINGLQLSVDYSKSTQQLGVLFSMLSNECVDVERVYTSANELEKIYLSLTSQGLRD